MNVTCFSMNAKLYINGTHRQINAELGARMDSSLVASLVDREQKHAYAAFFPSPGGIAAHIFFYR
jgi:hypothetical protein